MKIRLARATATRWVTRHACREEGFGGAFFSGWTAGLSATTELPPDSDLNLVVVIGRDVAPADPGRFVYHGVLLDVRYVAWPALLSASGVLSSYRLAPSFRTDTVIADPTGHLRRLHEHVADRFAKRVWVQRRCGDARGEIERTLRGVDTAGPLPAQVASLMSAANLAGQLVLIPALRHPQARRRYGVARKVLDRYGYPDIYPDLLQLLGCVHLAERRVQVHLQALAKTFDATLAASRSPYFLGAPISPATRPVVLGGNQRLIGLGYHREAMLWIVASFAQCHLALLADGSRHERRELAPLFEAALADLNLGGGEDVLDRAKSLLHYVPTLWGVADKILTANPRID